MKYITLMILLLSCTMTNQSIEHRMLIENFDSYKSFQFSDHNQQIENSNSLYDTKDIRRRLQSNIQCELEEKGLEEKESNADLIVEFHILIDNKTMTVMEIHDDHTSPFGYRDMDQRQINYKEGTLMIELIDRKSNHIIWYGVAKEILSPIPDFNQQKSQITETIAKLFESIKQR